MYNRVKFICIKVTLSYNCLWMIIISYLKPYDCVQIISIR